MIKVTIIRPNGYKMWFSMTPEEFQKWGDEVLKIRDLESVVGVEFNFQKEENKDVSKT